MNNDLISRSALKEWLTRPTGFRANCEDCTEIDCLDCIIDEAIDNAPAVDAETVFEAVGLMKEAFEMAKSTLAPAQKWISVKDRLPDSQADVLVVAFWHECWQPMIGWHSDSGEKWRVLTSNGEREPGGVTHWMPLPEPPKEG